MIKRLGNNLINGGKKVGLTANDDKTDYLQWLAEEIEIVDKNSIVLR